ncbi:MAG: GntR family transcriptional regulator [Bauldia sp.]|uniref:GntR family transcriptional regulator n=1 Tax=Bauldia sp. TaxID=2575872 RepID=UPI001E02B97B|nr:GntR family transcriptional regulator [Bauldia sp.]MCB1488000.1 GntR family transcriptional regulator [Bauldia sp.]MCB1495462.1 GntR family transcriptional regulator [Bauldia sp.]
MDTSHFEDLTAKIWASGTPREDLVQRVANALREQILSGRLAGGTRLVPEAQLARNLSISRPTLREAIRVLAREGLLEVKHGVGTFVVSEPSPILGSLEMMRSMTDLIRSVGGEPSVSDLEMEVTGASSAVADALEIAPETQVTHISRVRLIDGRPLVFSHEYLHLSTVDEDFKLLSSFDGGSLYEFLRSKCARPISHSRVLITAVAADADNARWLKLKRNAPLLLVRETHFDFNGRPILYAVSYHNSEVVEFTSLRSGLLT